MSKGFPQLLVCDKKGRMLPIPHLEATGMAAGHFFRLSPSELIRMPYGSEIFMLTDRASIGYDPATQSFTTLDDKYFALAAFIPPGHTGTYSSSYKEAGKPKLLPLFSYTAVALYKGEHHVAAIKVDDDKRHDCRYIDIEEVKKAAAQTLATFPRNRVARHLKDCALKYGCPGAQNFFLGRYEGPLPSSPTCNAVCLGCISLQVRKKCPATQPRITFTPTPEEISEIALFHIARVGETVVSFGQGCDGEPLLVSGVIEKAIKRIRKFTSKSVINMNTNGSDPAALKRLLDAGLNSIRVSMNSAQPKYYTAYYKPRGYAFNDVTKSIRIAKMKGAFVSVNYLTMPGLTDSKPEAAAFKEMLAEHRIDMVQWRNLNYDPLAYFRELKISIERSEVLGMRSIISSLKKRFPKLRHGYFNPMKIGNGSHNTK